MTCTGKSGRPSVGGSKKTESAVDKGLAYLAKVQEEDGRWDIGKGGGLDYDDEFLMGFDWCVASVHSYFDLDLVTQTGRLLKAMQHPAVSVIGHLSGRKIGRRPGIEFDVDAVAEAAALTGTALEINGAIDRLDATVPVLRRAREHGVRFTISTDSHHTDELRRHRWGTLHAQRAWISKEMVVNTWPRDRFLEWAAAKRS